MGQPDLPDYYDGVLGVAFLFGLPLIVWAWWRLNLDVELKIAAMVSPCSLSSGSSQASRCVICFRLFQRYRWLWPLRALFLPTGRGELSVKRFNGC